MAVRYCSTKGGWLEVFLVIEHHDLEGICEVQLLSCTGQPQDTRSDGPGRGCTKDVSVSMMLQTFVAASGRNGLKIKSSHAGDQPAAATSSYSEIELGVKPVFFLTWKGWCLCANLCAGLAAALWGETAPHCTARTWRESWRAGPKCQIFHS